jgi:hypothetical protein
MDIHNNVSGGFFQEAEMACPGLTMLIVMAEQERLTGRYKVPGVEFLF